jgi:hypothetical protein
MTMRAHDSNVATGPNVPDVLACRTNTTPETALALRSSGSWNDTDAVLSTLWPTGSGAQMRQLAPPASASHVGCMNWSQDRPLITQPYCHPDTKHI